ncbi:hypothetical protein SAMN04488058_103164 [Deinococcus reticulitermitis]|uniref:Uncharacterized protein n=1 Tax=Deinococcus reticulitermitis TaxID=856736 RepID=A0A1H6VT74_9DEIO|nr:hypothetical protein [Deinococcus reticulitermitis]SEJ03820.1 hypothetical protein SAMN04488058_103164 [Deinococcus reticulitermitis]
MPDAPAVTFPGPPRIPYPGGCVLEPGPYALEYLLIWPADVTVNGEVYANRQVFPFLRELLADPAAFGLSREEAEAARERFLTLAGQALSAEGGDPAWLRREFDRAPERKAGA